MYHSASSLSFGSTSWLGARRQGHGLSVLTSKKAMRQDEERLYQERLLRTKQEYVRQVMETYNRRKAQA